MINASIPRSNHHDHQRRAVTRQAQLSRRRGSSASTSRSTRSAWRVPEIARSDQFSRTMDGIQAAARRDCADQANMVVMKGHNDGRSSTSHGWPATRATRSVHRIMPLDGDGIWTTQVVPSRHPGADRRPLPLVRGRPKTDRRLASSSRWFSRRSRLISSVIQASARRATASAHRRGRPAQCLFS